MTEDRTMALTDAGLLDSLRSTARAIFADGAGLSVLGESGLLGLLTPEKHGGSGWNVVEAVTVAIEAGRGLSPEPWAGTLLAAAALGHADGHSGQSEGSGELLAELLEGRAVGGFVERPATGSESGGVEAVSGDYLLPGAARPAVVIIASLGAPLRAVALDGAGVQVAAQQDAVDSSRGAIRVTLAGAPGRRLTGADPDLLADAAVVLSCADTLGALAVTSKRVIGYLSQREAFGRPLAAFQALQHRLADLEVLIAAAEALVMSAATALAEGAADARYLVDILHTFMAERCVQALDDCIQLCGGIGVTWEWPVHHALRRSLANAAVRVRTPPTTEELRSALEGSRPGLPGTEAFREQVRSVIAENAPPPSREGHRAPTSPEEEAALRSWYRSLFSAGLLGAAWPQEWGGRPDHEPVHQLVVTEELIRARVPRPVDQVMLASHVLLQFGTAEQKQHYLPRIRASQDVWCQLFSEPGAGSDLAGVTTRAEQRDDGRWVVTGQKTWTTDAHWAQLGLALVRTSREDRRQGGLTVFAVPMDAPGVEIQPIRLMSGAHDINTVFLDGVVLGPEHVVGEVGQGWAVTMAGLEVERFGVGGNVVLLELLLRDVVAVAELLRWDGEPVIDSPALRVRITQLLAEFEAARAFVTGQIGRMLCGNEGVADGSIAKLLYTEAYNRIARFGVELVQGYGPVPASAAEAAGRLQDAWLWSRVLTISGGSSEVMRNIIAKRRLRLPT
jgi:alkylation response protein AidB-like acyl-CoA dehydrogenase